MLAAQTDVNWHENGPIQPLQVRNKALIQYTAPFVSVHLPTMATAINSTAE